MLITSPALLNAHRPVTPYPHPPPHSNKRELPYDPEIALLGIYPKDTNGVIQRGACTPMFIRAMSTIPKLPKEPRCSLIGPVDNEGEIYVSLHTHTHTHTHSPTDIHIHIYTYAYYSSRTHINIYIYMSHMYIYINIYDTMLCDLALRKDEYLALEVVLCNVR